MESCLLICKGDKKIEIWDGSTMWMQFSSEGVWVKSPHQMSGNVLHAKAKWTAPPAQLEPAQVAALLFVSQTGESLGLTIGMESNATKMG